MIQVDGVDLLNGTDYFDVTSDGVVTVKAGAVIDYEQLDLIVVKARLKVTYTCQTEDPTYRYDNAYE